MGRRKNILINRTLTQYQQPIVLQIIIAAILSISAGIVPLMMQLHLVEMDGITAKAYKGESSYLDVFNYMKSWVLTSVLVIFVLFWVIRLLQTHKFPKDTILAPLGAYVLFVVLSALFSPFKWISTKGFPDRLEGVFVLLAYCALSVTAAYTIRSDKVRSAILVFSMASSTVLSALGVSQYLGKDFLQTTRGKSLFIPDEYAVMFDKLTFNFGANIMYVTDRKSVV